MDQGQRLDDVLVAAAAATCTVVLTLTVEFGFGGSLTALERLAPLSVYFAYLFSRRGSPHGPLDTPRNWAVLAAVMTGGLAVWAVV
jgi:hypothetical protein